MSYIVNPYWWNVSKLAFGVVPASLHLVITAIMEEAKQHLSLNILHTNVYSTDLCGVTTWRGNYQAAFVISWHQVRYDSACIIVKHTVCVCFFADTHNVTHCFSVYFNKISSQRGSYVAAILLGVSSNVMWYEYVWTFSVVTIDIYW